MIKWLIKSLEAFVPNTARCWINCEAYCFNDVLISLRFDPKGEELPVPRVH